VESINILVMTPSFDETLPRANEEIIQQISRVSPKLKVTDGSVPAMAEFKNKSESKATLDTLLAEAEIIYGLLLPHNLLSRAPKLKWIQTISAGVNRFTGTDIWNSPVILTSASGIHATPIGEFVLGFMLMFAKRAPLFIRSQLKHEWTRLMPTVLRDKTVGIVGLGHIGREVARLAKAFGMRVIATRRSAGPSSRARNVDRLLPVRQLKQLLSESDYVVVATPLTPETTGLIGLAELKAMKPTACIINIGRGGIIDETALIQALDDGEIAGAGLDVTATEPLPMDSPLWDRDNVIISPHISGGMEDYMQRATDLFCENLKRYIGGKRLINIVDKKRGY
jgi:phosphoglycerate dehydrogenase-like enzyme